MIEVEKRDGESNDSLMRRFSRKLQSSGVLFRKKKMQYMERKPNKRQLRESAKIRTARQVERAFLIKIGKLEETPRFGRGSRKVKKS